MLGITITSRARISQIPTARLALSNTSIRTISSNVTAAVFTVIAVLVLMAVWFAKMVCLVTEESWRVIRPLAVSIFRASFWVRDVSGLTIEIVVESYSLFHNDVVAGTLSNRITYTSLLSLGIGEVGDLVIDTQLCAK